MTKQELDKAVAAYLDENEDKYEDVISSLSASIKDYYDKKEAKEKAISKAKITAAREDLSLAATDYVDAIYGGMSEEEYDAVNENILKAITDCEAELIKILPTIKKFNAEKATKEMKRKRSDTEILNDFFSRL